MSTVRAALGHVVPVMATLFMAAGTVYFFVLDEGGERGAAAPASGPRPAVKVYSTVYPVADFVRRLAGQRVDSACLVPPGTDVASWWPDAVTTRWLQEADLLLLNGAGMEPWAASLALSPTRTLETASGLRDEIIQMGPSVTHSHGPGGHHTHRGTNPFTWMDPRLAMTQASAVAVGLSRVLRRDVTAFDEELRRLTEELEALDQKLAALGPLPDGEVMVGGHPGYQYLCRRYRWPVVELDLEPDEVLAPSGLAAARRQLSGHVARIVLLPTAPAAEQEAQLRAELGLEVVLFSVCAAPPDSDGAGYVELMRANARRLAAAWSR